MPVGLRKSRRWRGDKMFIARWVEEASILSAAVVKCDSASTPLVLCLGLESRFGKRRVQPLANSNFGLPSTRRKNRITPTSTRKLVLEPCDASANANVDAANVQRHRHSVSVYECTNV